MTAAVAAALGILGALGAVATLVALKGRRTLHELLRPGLYRSEAFPEDSYPARDAGAFRARVERGYARMREATVVLCGITRDDADTLPLTIRRLERTGERFREYAAVVFESGSTDETPAILRAWAARNPRVTILSEPQGGRSGDGGDRFARLAWCRNHYVDHLNGSPELGGRDYVLVVDMDLSGGWSLDGLASTFAEEGWDGVASNSLGYHYLRRTYYDTAALRPRSVLKETAWHRLVGEAWQLRRGGALIPVTSAFGGVAVYRREVFRSRRYSGRSGGVSACEHVSLNEDGRLRFFLNPSQITVVGTQDARARDRRPRWRRSLDLLLRNW